MTEPDNGDDPATNDPGSPRHWTPFSITTAVAIPLLAIAVSIVAVIVTGSGGSKSGAATGPTTTQSASSTSLLDPCLFGMWIQQDNLPDQLTLDDGSVVKPVTRTGAFSLYFGSDGRGAAEADMWVRGTHDGKPIELNIAGEDAFTYTVRDSTVHYVRTSNSVQQVLYVDGRKVGSKPVDDPWRTDQATCTLAPARLTLANVDGTFHFDRPAP